MELVVHIVTNHSCLFETCSEKPETLDLISLNLRKNGTRTEITIFTFVCRKHYHEIQNMKEHHWTFGGFF